MPFLLAVVERFFVGVFAVSAGTFRGPGGVGDPVVVEDGPVEGGTTGTGEVDLL